MEDAGWQDAFLAGWEGTRQTPEVRRLSSEGEAKQEKKAKEEHIPMEWELTEDEIESIKHDPWEWEKLEMEKAYPHDWKGDIVDFDFKSKLIHICKNLGIAPEDLMKVMVAESGLDPKAKNESGAVGLIQMTKKGAEFTGTTTEALEQMDAMEQLDYIEKFFAPNAGKMHSVGDVYSANMAPGLKVFGDLDAPIYVEGTEEYRNNSAMDLDDNGQITQRDLLKWIDRRLEDYWNYWENRG